MENLVKQQQRYSMPRNKAAEKSRSGKKQRKKKADKLLRKALVFHQNGDASTAEKYYKKSLSTYPKNSDALGNLAILLHSQGQTEKALEYYHRALTLSPNKGHLHYYLGNGLKEQGSYEEAVTAYENALTCGHEELPTLFQLGVSYSALGQVPAARECFNKILRMDPSCTEASYHLGLLAFTETNYQKAIDYFGSVLQEDVENVDACFNLALCHKALGNVDSALDFLNKAHEISPDDGDIVYNIGVLHKNIGEFDKAEAAFLKALETDAAQGIILTDLAILYHLQNRLDEAQAMYKKALASGYHTEAASHMIAALSGNTTTTAPHEYVLDLFDNYAPKFEQSLLHDLHYDIPRQLAEMFRSHHDKPLAKVLDLGCGTGMAGQFFRKSARHLTGIDLSKNMLALAEQKRLYDQLHCRDIVEFLQATTDEFQLIIAADVFVYLGRLEPLFTAINDSHPHTEYLIFSVERCAGSSYRLCQSGRYAHSISYISRLAETFAFTLLERKETGIRKERGTWIQGDIYLLQRRQKL